MPFAIKRINGKQCVVNSNTGRVLGRHDGKPEALAQLFILNKKLREGDIDGERKGRK